MARARYIRNKLKNLKMGRSAVGFISEAGELLGFYRGLRKKDPDNHELLENNKQIYKYIDLYQSKSTYQEMGGFKPSMKLTFVYEFLLRLTYNSVKMMTIPRIGYKHVNLREGSIFWNYIYSIVFSHWF